MTKSLMATLGTQLILQVAFYVHFYWLAKKQALKEAGAGQIKAILQAQVEQAEQIQLLAREITALKQKQETAKSKCDCKDKATVKTTAIVTGAVAGNVAKATKTRAKKSTTATTK